jgi:hypothetical protein
VLVIQGTLATEPTNLLLPAIEALPASDALVIGTTGGPEPGDVLGAGVSRRRRP